MDNSNRISRATASSCLVVGAVFGMVGTFVPSSPLRGLLWGIDGVALIVAAALLTLHYFRQGNTFIAAGFLVFVAGETLILSTAAANAGAAGPAFGAGVSLWSASLILISLPKTMSDWLRSVGAIAALLFLVVAVDCFMGHDVTPLSRPLPFFAYPFLALTLLGWAWTHYHEAR